MSAAVVDSAGKRLSLSNLEKVLYPSVGLAKAGILDYYRRMAGVLLPHISNRALTFKRYPEGVEKDFFFEKRCPDHRPSWVQTATIPNRKAGNALTVCLVNDRETLLWAANLASLELHVPLARAGSPERPDFMVFDLDPGEDAGLAECGKVALILRDLLSRLGLAGFVKTSGRKGLHVYVPLNRREVTFENTRIFSKTTAAIMQKHYPELVTARMAKRERAGKVFINWSQNDAAKTMIAVYSLRAREIPYVSFPVAWKSVENAVRTGRLEDLEVRYRDAQQRIADQGDLFHDVLVKEQKLPHL